MFLPENSASIEAFTDLVAALVTSLQAIFVTSTCQRETCLFQFFWNIFLSLCLGIGDGVLLWKPRSTVLNWVQGWLLTLSLGTYGIIECQGSNPGWPLQGKSPPCCAIASVQDLYFLESKVGLVHYNDHSSSYKSFGGGHSLITLHPLQPDLEASACHSSFGSCQHWSDHRNPAP